MLRRLRRARGFTLLEVLITIVILAIGLLGVANLQAVIHTSEMESYQRAQAVLLLQDMVDRISTNRSGAATYVTTALDPAFLGIGSGGDINDCSDADIDTPLELDQCQWGNALKGAAETKGAASVGAMLGARGCVDVVTAQDLPSCTPGVYRVTVVWQGLSATAEPALTCANDQDFGGAGLRRAIATTVTVGLPQCNN